MFCKLNDTIKQNRLQNKKKNEGKIENEKREIMNELKKEHINISCNICWKRQK